MMFKRLRTKLVVVSLLLFFATIIPVVLIPYYILQSEALASGNRKLGDSRKEIGDFMFGLREGLEDQAGTLKSDIESRLSSGAYRPEAFQTKESLQEIADSLASNIRRYDLRLLGVADYSTLRSEMSEEPGLLEFDARDKPGHSVFAAWSHRPILYEDIEIGGLVVMRPVFESQPTGFGSSVQDEAPSAEERAIPELYPHRWPGRILTKVSVNVTSMQNAEFQATLERYPELREGVLTSKMLIAENIYLNEEQVQANWFPFSNHKGEVIGVLIISVPRISSFWAYTQRYTLFAVGMSLVLAVLLGAVVARSIAAPVNRLVRTAKKMAAGDLAARVEVTSSDEIGTLSKAFNDMAETVEASHAELEKRASDLQESNRLLGSANLELDRTRQFLENLLANIRTGVMALDMAGRVVRLNRAASEILGCQASDEGRHFHDLVGRGTFAQLAESTLHKGVSIFQREVQHTNTKGYALPLQLSTVPMLYDGQLTGMVVTFHDLSNVRRLEEQLVRQDRLAALGRLSAGVAHEIRNPLGIMKGSAELLKRRFGGMPREEGLTDFILEEIDRLSRVVSDFLNFARPPAPELQRREVNDIVHRATAFLEHQDVPAPINYRFELATDLPPVALDSNLFQQVMLNLLLNAQESMPKGGTVAIRTAMTESAEIAMEIVDEGVGIADDELDRIFDPFVSTKENGTGLGLSVVHQIVVGHGGRLEVESEVGEGSTFRVILPTYMEEVTPEVLPAAS